MTLKYWVIVNITIHCPLVIQLSKENCLTVYNFIRVLFPGSSYTYIARNAIHVYLAWFSMAILQDLLQWIKCILQDPNLLQDIKVLWYFLQDIKNLARFLARIACLARFLARKNYLARFLARKIILQDFLQEIMILFARFEPFSCKILQENGHF